MRRKWEFILAVIFLLFLFNTHAFATGINIHCKGVAGSGRAQDRNGNDLNTDSIIQWIYGNPSAPNPANPGFLHQGTLFSTYNIGVGTNNQNGTFDINTIANQTTWLRIWENGGPAENAYYATISKNTDNNPLVSPAGPMPSDNHIATFRTNYKAAKPPLPQATATGFSLTYNAASEKYLPSFTISAVDQNDPAEPGIRFETAGYNLAIRKKGNAWDPARVFPRKSQTITETDLENPYFVADGQTEYEVRAQAWNYFGGNTDQDWGEVNTFIIPGSELAPAAPTFTPVFNADIELTEAPNKVKLTWQGPEDGVDIYSSSSPNSGYAILEGGANVQGTEIDNLEIDNATYFRIVPTGRVPVGAENANTPAETLGIHRSTFEKVAQGYGINTFVMPFASIEGQENKAIATAKDLIDEIRSQNNNTTAIAYFGYWISQAQGVMLEYEEGNIKSTSGEFGTDNLENINLSRNQGYQISVSEPISFTLVGKM